MFSHSLRASAALVWVACAAAGPRVLRVCADPNNLPFSNESGEGLENRLAEVLARDLGAELRYVWFSERKNFLKNSLDAGLCDAVPGVPVEIGDALVTRPYYRSTYVTVTRADRALRIESLYDPRLKDLRIGLHVVEDDYAPPGHLLAAVGLSSNLTGYSLFGAYGEKNPAARLIDAAIEGKVDVAIAWGPLAGYFAKKAPGVLRIEPVSPTRFGMAPFTYSIGVAVRRGNEGLRSAIQGVLDRECPQVHRMLTEYGVPEPREEAVSCDTPSSAAVWLH